MNFSDVSEALTKANKKYPAIALIEDYNGNFTTVGDSNRDGGGCSCCYQFSKNDVKRFTIICFHNGLIIQEEIKDET